MSGPPEDVRAAWAASYASAQASREPAAVDNDPEQVRRHQIAEELDRAGMNAAAALVRGDV